MEENTQLKNTHLIQNKSSSINKNSFQFLYVIGKGGFGKYGKFDLKKQKKYMH